jgi:predicted amidohydrolase YtcJ
MLILHHGNIYTQYGQNPRAQALAIEGERILAPGSNEDILALARPGSSLFDLQGHSVWPGLCDAHLHLQTLALLWSAVDCETASKAECLSHVAERALQTPPGEWILGHGWNQTRWPEGFGSAAELDAVSTQHPIYLTAKSLHAGWANRCALQACEISAATPDPEGGVIQRDDHGQPTGILLEKAMSLVAPHMPMPDAQKLASLLQDAQSTLWQMGLTAVHDFDPLSSFEALQILHEGGKLHLRVTKSLPLTSLPHAAALGLHSGFGDDWLRIGPVKLFADGALGLHTAAMLAPFDDDKQNRGMLLLSKEQILEHGKTAARSGLSLAIHAIGDRANHEVLDGFALLRDYESTQNLPHLRHRIEHVQLLDPADQVRLAQLGIIASMQPIHAPSDREMVDASWGARAANAYAWRGLIRHNTHLAFGSDAPVESPTPFWGLHAAVNRNLPHSDQPAWHPEQALSLAEALFGFTLGQLMPAEWKLAWDA